MHVKQIVWNFKPLFRSDDDPSMSGKRKLVTRKSYEFINKWKDRTDYLRDPSVLKNALDEYEKWLRHYGSDGDEGYYFWLRTQQDKNDPELKARFNKIEEFSKKIENDIQFFLLRIAKIPPKKQQRFLEYKGLKTYRHFLERTFAESRFLLSEAEERILNLKMATSYANWVRMISSLLAREERKVFAETGKSEVKNFSEIMSLMNSSRKKVRDSSAHAFNEILVKYSDIAETEINSVLAHKKVDDEIRGVPRPDLTRHISDDIDSEIVDALVTSVSERFSIPARYYRLKARLFKVRKLKYHERNLEYGTINIRYPFNDAIRIISTAARNLDPSFEKILKQFLDYGHFDVYPRKGKGSGALCAHHRITQPTYILLNHTDRLSDVLTLAHELGHGINNELMKKTQHALNFGSPLSTAEVASTFMEDFVLRELLKGADEGLRLSILLRKLNDDVSTIFRQVACYRYEQELHIKFREKGYVSKHEIGTLFQKHMSSYMGTAVEQSEGSENWWIYWNHIRVYFYVYSYASGLLISKSLQNSVRKNPLYIDKVKEFLSAGQSDSPKAIFGTLGINIAGSEFWDRGIDEIEQLLEETVFLAKKLGRI